VPELPTQRLRFRDCERPVQAELEPTHEVGGERDDRLAGPVGVEINEWEPVQTGVFQPADVVLDVRMRAHVGVEGDEICVVVGVGPSSGIRATGTAMFARRKGTLRDAR
jgi:hypothetical protein